jgi:hypothetical protein
MIKYVYLLTTIWLKTFGSSRVHIDTQTIHRTIHNIITITIHNIITITIIIHNIITITIHNIITITIHNIVTIIIHNIITIIIHNLITLTIHNIITIILHNIIIRINNQKMRIYKIKQKQTKYKTIYTKKKMQTKNIKNYNRKPHIRSKTHMIYVNSKMTDTLFLRPSLHFTTLDATSFLPT